MAKNGYNPIKSGVDPRKDNVREEHKNTWLRLATNQQVDVVILVDIEDIITIEQCAIWLDREVLAANEGMKSPVWTYIGPNDPFNELNGVQKSYRAFLPCLVKDEVKVLAMGKMLHGQLLDVADAAGSIAGMEVRIKRTGQGLGTRYSLVPTSKRFDVDSYDEVDIIPLLGPLTSEGVRDLIANRLQLNSYDEVLEAYGGKAIPATKVAKPVKKKAKPAPVVEEEDEEEDLLLDDEEDDD